jgi:hypothetical protein
MALLTFLTDIFLRILVEGLFATNGAKVIFLSLVFGSSRSLFFVHLHLAYRVYCHHVTSLDYLPTWAGLNLLKRSELDTTVMELAAIAAAAIMGLRKP